MLVPMSSKVMSQRSDKLQMQQLKFVGLAGFATAGKDLFYSILDKAYPSIRFSLGDVLKREIRESLLEETSIDILNCGGKDKEKVRPMLVEYGRKKREERTLKDIKKNKLT